MLAGNEVATVDASDAAGDGCGVTGGAFGAAGVADSGSNRGLSISSSDSRGHVSSAV